MQRVPYAKPWEGAEGERQDKLGVRNACALARRFDADGSEWCSSMWRHPKRSPSTAPSCTPSAVP